MTGAFDVAIVGPGTVGLYLAAALPDGLRVALVGTGLDPEQLLGPSPSTSGHTGVIDGWAGGHGGTSTRWGGQLWPWRPWEVAGGPSRTAWPLDFERDLAPHYTAVLQGLGLDSTARTVIHDNAGTARWAHLRTDFTEVRYSTWMDRRHRDFRRNRSIQSRAAAAERIAANAARVEPRPGGRHALLDAAGIEIAVADKVVLAAGTLGNIRLVQASFPSSADRPVGRYFGDHLSARTARARVVDRARFTDFAASSFIRHGRTTTRLATTAAHSAQTGAMPAYAHFEVASAMLRAARDLSRARGTDALEPAGRLLRQAPKVPAQAAAALGALRRHRRPLDVHGEVFVRIDVEQPLRSTSSIAWSDDGSLHVDWSIGDQERRSTSAALQRLAPLMEAHLGVELEPIDEPQLVDIYHLIGGTRMGFRDDASAVVDEHLRLLDADGVFVAGASTFPSGGMANPTFTALALADRLTEQLI